MHPAFFKFISLCTKKEQTFFFSTKGVSFTYLICSLKLIVSLNKDLDLVIAHPHSGSSFTIPGRVGI